MLRINSNWSVPVYCTNSCYSSKPVRFKQNSIMENSAVTDKTAQEPDKISVTRLAFNYLSDEQIKEINETRQLPANAKFISNGAGGYTICNNFFNIRPGTQTLPEGFEVKRDALGFAIVVPKGTEGLLIRKSQ